MIGIGLVLLVLGWLLGIGILQNLGVVLLVIGVLLVVVQATPYGWGDRRHFW